MYPDYQFWLEQAIAYCVAALIVCIVDKINFRKHSKETEE